MATTVEWAEAFNPDDIDPKKWPTNREINKALRETLYEYYKLTRVTRNIRLERKIRATTAYSLRKSMTGALIEAGCTPTEVSALTRNTWTTVLKYYEGATKSWRSTRWHEKLTRYRNKFDPEYIMRGEVVDVKYE